jgi:hypothetical protein
MCRADVEPRAEEAVAHLLLGMAQALADEADVDVPRIRIGPVDFGHPLSEAHGAVPSP